MHDQGYRLHTALHLGETEEADIVAREDTEILQLVLPDLAGIAALRHAQTEAAE